MKKITSRRELAIALSNGSVDLLVISKSLTSVVEMWIARKEVNVKNGLLILSK